MMRAWYSLFQVEAAVPGVGAHVQDILRQRSRLLIDLGLAQSVTPGVLIATRVFPHDGFLMTGGAPLPLAGDNANRDTLIQVLTKWVFAADVASAEELAPEQ